MTSPSDLKFSESHEWFSSTDATVTIGITQYAADELTDLTYVELKPVGTIIGPDDTIGEVESVKTTSDVVSVVAGEIVEINSQAIDDPSLLNTDPFGEGWLVRIKTKDTSPLDNLMDQATYDSLHPVGS